MKKNKILLFPPQKSISPGDDFFKHINGNWLRRAHMPPFISSYSISEEIEDQIAGKLMTEIDRSIADYTENKHLPREREEIAILALSALHTANQQKSVDFLKSLVDKLGCIRDINDVASTLGDFCRYRVNTLLQLFAGPESKHSKTMRICIGSGSIGLPDISYYKATAPGKMRTLLAYIALLKQLGKDFDVPNLELVASLESTSVLPLAKALGDDEILMSGAEIHDTYKNTPWSILFKTALDLNPSEWANKQFLVLSKSWLSYVNKLFKNVTISQWKIWFAGDLILHALPILPPPYDDLHFQLFGKRLRGQTEKIPQKNLALMLCQQWLTTSLGKVFEECCLDKDAVRRAKHMCKQIQSAAVVRITHATWLTPRTRRKAVTKVNHVYFGVGIPETWPHTYEQPLVRDTLLKNILLLGEARTKNDLEAAKHPLQVRAWDDQSFAVNAYYYSEGNRLLLPGGILQSPFFDLTKSHGWNYGGIGCAIGHELTHAFDIEGKEFNEKGDQLPWWLPSDNRAYNKITRNLVELFNTTTYQGHPVNGTLTLSENIADLGGVAMSLSALEEQIKHKSPEEKKQDYIDFFTAYAVSWRIKEKRAASLQGLMMDRHAPAALRVNLVVAQFQQWYDAFDVK
jgi:predicted metalloendopeptidase